MHDEMLIPIKVSNYMYIVFIVIVVSLGSLSLYL